MASYLFAKATPQASLAGTALVFALTACSDAPIALSSQRSASPDGKRSAVVEKLDNGLGFGLGAIMHEVHVVGATEEVRTHGNGSRSLVFYADTTDYRGPPITVKWLSSNQLQINYGKLLTPERKERHLGEISVEYVAE